MKIAIDCHKLQTKNWAGTEQYLISFLEKLKKENEDHEYILYFRKAVFPKNYFPQNFRIKNIQVPVILWQIYVLIDLWRMRADLLIAPAFNLLAGINFFIPMHVIVHDLTTFIPNISKTHTWVTRMREKFIISLKNAQKIITVSQNSKKDLIHFFNVDSTKIEISPPEIHSRFRKIKDQDTIDQKLAIYHLPSDFILSIGTLEPRKNIDGLIHAYALLAKEVRDLPKLLIVGKKGWFYEKIFRKVQELKLADDIIFTNYLLDEVLPYLYNRARFLVYPSFYEGFGMPVLEAMRCACPVISSRVSSLPEVLGDRGILINPYNIVEIKEAMKVMWRDALNLRISLLKD